MEIRETKFFIQTFVIKRALKVWEGRMFRRAKFRYRAGLP